MIIMLRHIQVQFNESRVYYDMLSMLSQIYIIIILYTILFCIWIWRLYTFQVLNVHTHTHMDVLTRVYIRPYTYHNQLTSCMFPLSTNVSLSINTPTPSPSHPPIHPHAHLSAKAGQQISISVLNSESQNWQGVYRQPWVGNFFFAVAYPWKTNESK